MKKKEVRDGIEKEMKEMRKEKIVKIFHKYCSRSSDNKGGCFLPSSKYDEVAEMIVSEIVKMLNRIKRKVKQLVFLDDLDRRDINWVINEEIKKLKKEKE